MSHGGDAIITSLLQWMKAKNNIGVSSKESFVSLKVGAKDFGDEGRGLAANDNIVQNEEIIKIPHSYLLNAHTIIRHISHFNKHTHLNEHYSNIDISYEEEPKDEVTQIYSKIQYNEMVGLSSFQLVSLYLCLETGRQNSFWKPFLDSLPDIKAFNWTPLVWEETGSGDLIEFLPSEVKEHHSQVSQRYNRDKEAVKKFLTSKLPETTSVDKYITSQRYLWAWMCINSRCLYMELRESNDNADNFTMAPLVDFVNHSDDDHCRLKIDNKGFHVITTTKYEPQSQIYLSYGPHSNGFLLCEYGFVLPSNKWNDIDISRYIKQDLNEDQVKFLKQYEYFDNYTIGKVSGVSYRTEIALAVMQESKPFNSRKLLAYVKGLTDGESYGESSKEILHDILNEVESDISGKRAQIKEIHDESKRVIIQLYSDIEEIIDATKLSFINA
ncbi:ribosomal lysine N-methyltransferase 2 [[Candida] jaroonii]|uniref:Ribosomal lysine N-methyltransferase 2 n=1 Tax=[Candida] jaroonii TaxID=467808 RepID=A0ACA9Y2I9_9ASCO|nr:ribosomal lysine N-methyltransferase 2 [[Candida] jaroonii]